jgi:hypothetical protein
MMVAFANFFLGEVNERQGNATMVADRRFFH